MAKERLSKLQKWILSRCLKNKADGVYRNEAREFFGKKLPPKRHLIEALKESTFGTIGEKFEWDGRYYTAKKELVSTRSVEAVITRSLGNLKQRGFITEKNRYSQHYLTERGFLKANKINNSETVSLYEDYIDTIHKENEERTNTMKKLVGDLADTLKNDSKATIGGKS